MEKSNIIYVETHVENINTIISEISLTLGVSHATIKVQKWFKDYSAFVYDPTNGNLLFYKTRYAGYWEMEKVLTDYRK